MSGHSWPPCECPACVWYRSRKWENIHQANTDKSGVTIAVGLDFLVVEVLELKAQVTALKDEVWELRQEVRRLQGRHQ